MEVTEIVDNIYHVHYDTQVELTSSFLRFQEHYESPEFRGKIFSLDEYKEWYINNSPQGRETGEFTYYTDWAGFNIPSSVMDPFYSGEFKEITNKEQALLDQFENVRNEKFYVLGTYGQSNLNTLKHEVAHGLFYTNQDYHDKAMNIIDKMDSNVREKIVNFLSNSGGYHPDVCDDETHAYLTANYDYLVKKGILEDSESSRKISAELNENFSAFCDLDLGE